MHSDVDATPDSARSILDRRPWPYLIRPDLPIRVVHVWRGMTADTQARAADGLASSWRTTEWPAALRSVSLFTSTDGGSVMAYAQLSNEPDADDRVRLSRLMTLETGAGAAPYPAPDVQGYRVVRQAVRASDAVPGTIAFIQIDTDNDGVARAWIDAVFDAMASEPMPIAGSIGGHFHVALDGTRVINYAEWESEAAHDAALDVGGGAVGTVPAWRRVREMPGTRRGGFARYTAVLTLETPKRVSVVGGDADV